MTKNNLKTKTLLLINPGSSLKTKFLRRAKELGINIIAVCNPDAELIQETKRYIKEYIYTNTYKIHKAVRDVEKYFQSTTKPDGLITYWERDLYVTGLIAKKLNLNFLSQEVIQKTSRNKYKMYDRLSRDGLFQKKFYLVASFRDLKRAAANLTFPVVLKPVAGTASKGVRKINSPAEITPHFWRTYCTDHSPDKDPLYLYTRHKYIAMEYIQGKEFSVEGYVYNNVPSICGIIEKFPLRGSYFIEKGDFSIPRISQTQMVEIAEHIKRVVSLLGLNNCVFHAEVKWDNKLNRPQIIEVNPRIGGDYVWEYIYETYNVDLAKIMFKLALGIKLQSKDTYLDYNSGKLLIGTYFLPHKNGILKNISLGEKLVSANGFVYDLQLPQTNTLVGVPPEKYDYLGWIIVKDNLKNVKTTISNLLSLQKEVRFTIQSH